MLQPVLLGGVLGVFALPATADRKIGEQVSVPRHLVDGQEFALALDALLRHGRTLFSAVWTGQESGDRPLTKGTGAPLSDSSSPLVFPRNFNRLSAPDANSCAGCHNAPFGIPGGGGDIVGNVFTSGADDPNREPLDQSQAAGTPAFFAGYGRFLTRKLWGAANEPPYFHHGQFTTLRDAVLAHYGEANAERLAFERLDDYSRDSIIEFLKSLQVLPPGTRSLVVDEYGRPRH